MMVITNARRHRDEQQARANLETLIETSPVGVVVFDARTGAPVSFNHEASRIAYALLDGGESPGQVLGVATCVRADGRELPLEEYTLAQLMSAGETVRAEEIILKVPDGRSVTALLNASPIRSEEGEVESFVVTLQDMTPLENLERLRAEFLGMISHELRTPLATIKGSISTLLSGPGDLDPAVMTQFHRIIDQQVDHMHDLVSNLLDVARVETGTLSVELGPANVADMVDEARNRFLSAGGGSNLKVDLPPDLPLVMADRRRIVQVLGNLLSNAARYSPEGSPIRVNAARDGVLVAVSIADAGKGVPLDLVPHLFRKSSRLSASDRVGVISGSGLGLTLCKGIVEAHGGRIWVESDGPGTGARFTLKAGYHPIVTGDPDEVSQLVSQEKPDLVLLDLMLPGSDGTELMKEILEIADVPVIFLSAYGQEDVVARAFDLGASDYVVKPFSPTELAARIRAALRKRTPPERSQPPEPYLAGDLRIDYAERQVSAAGRPVRLTATEYALLYELSVESGRVLTHDYLLQSVWGRERTGEPRLLRDVVKRLRRKLGDDADDPTYIFTEPRVGYRMVKGETPVASDSSAVS